MKTLKEHNQNHIYKYYNELTNDQKNILDTQILAIDFDKIDQIYANRNKTYKEDNVELSPIIPHELSQDEEAQLFNEGLEIIKEKKVAVVLMAGGQGTRLGHSGPKGTFDINLPSHKSLFNIQCDKLGRLYDMTHTYIKWYIMTSEDNHEETVNHFIENDYFDYDSKSILFFKQDRLPLVLENGKIAMKNKYEMNLAANGNGGVFSSLKSNGILNQMHDDGVEFVFLYGVDNVLAKVADPTFVAFSHKHGQEITSKAVDKTEPDEKVGLMCYKNGLPGIVEYSEIDEELKNKRDENGKLLFRNGNILSHIFTLDFLMKCSEMDIPYHSANKKVGTYQNDKFEVSDKVNGYKFELFMFDVFQYADDMPVLTVKRENEFAPVKNKTGNDSPETAKKYILELHKKWLEEFDIVSGELIEIDSRRSYNGENLEDYKK